MIYLFFLYVQGNPNLANLTKLHHWLKTSTPSVFQENPNYLPLHAMLGRHFQASQPIHSRSRCYTLAADLLRCDVSRGPWLLTKTHPPPAPTRPVHREHRPHLQPLHTSVNHPRPVILRRPAATSGRLAANRRLPAPQPLTVEVGDYHPISPLLPTSVGKQASCNSSDNRSWFRTAARDRSINSKSEESSPCGIPASTKSSWS